MKLIVQTAAERCHDRHESPADAQQATWENAPTTGYDNLLPRDLTVLEEEIVRLEKMLQMFLDFARPPLPEKQQVDVRLMIECTLDFIGSRAKQQGVKLHPSSLDEQLWILADQSQMRQVLLNLVLNSLDAMPGGGNVWVAAHLETCPAAAVPGVQATAPHAKSADKREPEPVDGTSQTYVTISVSDDGPGLSAKDLERIFDPFVSTKPTGIGLGLSICRRIVESHDGLISVGNRDAGGVEFTIRLPPLTL